MGVLLFPFQLSAQNTSNKWQRFTSFSKITWALSRLDAREFAESLPPSSQFDAENSADFDLYSREEDFNCSSTSAEAPLGIRTDVDLLRPLFRRGGPRCSRTFGVEVDCCVGEYARGGSGWRLSVCVVLST